MTPARDTSFARLWLPYLLDIAGPFAAYLLVTAFGASAVWALTAGGLVAGLSTVVNTVRRRGLDVVGALVLLELCASVAILILVRDPRLMLIRPSFYTGLAAVYLLASAAFGRPLTYDGARPMAARGGPERLAAYDRAWENSPEFRMTHRLMTAGFGVALAADSILRVVIVYSVGVQRGAWLSNLPHVAAVVLFIGASALAGRRFKRLVDAQQTGTA